METKELGGMQQVGCDWISHGAGLSFLDIAHVAIERKQVAVYGRDGSGGYCY